jgi:hypothetical protein
LHFIDRRGSNIGCRVDFFALRKAAHGSSQFQHRIYIMKSWLIAGLASAVLLTATAADAGYRRRGSGTRPSYASASYIATPQTGYRTISSYPAAYAHGYPNGPYAYRAALGYGYYRPYGTYYAPGYGSYSFGAFPSAYAPSYLPPRYYGGVGYWGGVGSGYYYGAGSRSY